MKLFNKKLFSKKFIKTKFFHEKKSAFVKKNLAVVAAAMLAIPALAQVPVVPSPAAAHWTVENGKLLDSNGNPFIFRGVTIDHIRAPDKTVQALKDIAALGANSAQIEFPINWTVPFTYPRTAVTELVEIIKTCADTKLVCVLEPNDVAGFGPRGVDFPSATVALWASSDMTTALSAPGVANHIIIGFGNQHYGSGAAQFYKDSIYSYTSGLFASLPPGFLVMIDGSDWAQDTSRAMHHIAQMMNQDSTLKHRVIYSVDFFSEYVDPNKVRDYITSFAEIGAPLVVGGFGPMAYYHPYYPAPLQLDAPQLPAASVMQYAQQYGAGYFGWSWSGNANPALDVVSNWNPNNLTAWGNLLFNDANGIKATAKIASVFQNVSSSQGASSFKSSTSSVRNSTSFSSTSTARTSSSFTSTSAIQHSSSSNSVSSVGVSSSSVDGTNLPPVANFSFYSGASGECEKAAIQASSGGSFDPDGDEITYSWTITGAGPQPVNTGQSARFIIPSGAYGQITLTVTDSKGAATSVTKNYTPVYIDCFGMTSSSRSSTRNTNSSSSHIDDASRPATSSRSSIRSTSSARTSSSYSSAAIAKAQCSYQIQSQWHNGFTAVVRIKNTTNTVINGWDVNWQYADDSKITNLWNANWSGANPYNAKNLGWNSTIPPGQTVEFGFQGSKTAAIASVPVVTGAICQ